MLYEESQSKVKTVQRKRQPQNEEQKRPQTIKVPLHHE